MAKKAGKVVPMLDRNKAIQRIADLERENQGLRDCYFAVVKHFGRVRLPNGLMATLNHGDSVDVQVVGDEVMLTFVPSNMVVPGGKAS